MNIRSLNHRVHRVEQRLCPKRDNSVTLEEVYRTIWNDNPNGFRQLAAECGGPIRVFLARFENGGRWEPK